MTSSRPSIDLSEFDPFHTPARVASPRIFAPTAASSFSTSSTSSSSSSSASVALPRPPSTLPTQTVQQGQDPLDLFSLLNLGQVTSPSSSSSIASTSTVPFPSSLAPPGHPIRKHVQAQNEQQENFWNELHRGPWSCATSTTSATSFQQQQQQHQQEEERIDLVAPTSLPIPTSRKPVRRMSSSNSSFSPPRGLSGLMMDPVSIVSNGFLPLDPDSSTSLAITEPVSFGGGGGSTGTTSTSRPTLEPFHPASPPVGSFEKAFSLVRRMSNSNRPSTSTSPQRRRRFSSTHSSSSPSAAGSDDWGDFHSGGFEPTNNTTTSSVLREASTATIRTNSLPPRNSTTTLTRQTARSQTMPPPIPAVKPEHVYDPRAPDAVQPITLAGVRPGVQRALDEDIADGIRPSLPPRLRISHRWTLVYSLDQHGISIGTMYERMRAALHGIDGGVVLVVKDSNGSVFGAYVNEPLKETKHYYGDGTCFLWKASPFPASDFRVGYSTQAFRWTGRNDYLALTEADFISIGGGDGKFGLWIDGVFEKGYTTRCPCFDNEPLTNQKEWVEVGKDGEVESKFEVVQFECWAVGL